MDQESRTEKPTDKKRREERKKGHVAKTMELNSSLILLADFVLFSFLAGSLIQGIISFMVKTFTFMPVGNLTLTYLNNMAGEAAGIYAKTAGPFLLCSVVVGLLVSISQVKLVFSFEYLKQAGSRLNPILGMKKFFQPNHG